MKIEKLFTVLVVGGGMLAGCGGQQTKATDAPASAPAAPTSEAAPADAPPAAPTSKEDGDAGGCGWF